MTRCLSREVCDTLLRRARAIKLIISSSRFFYHAGMYVILTLNLIVNVVTLISSLLLITGSIKVSREQFNIHIMQLYAFDFDHDSEKLFYFAAQFQIHHSMARIGVSLPRV